MCAPCFSLLSLSLYFSLSLIHNHTHTALHFSQKHYKDGDISRVLSLSLSLSLPTYCYSIFLLTVFLSLSVFLVITGSWNLYSKWCPWSKTYLQLKMSFLCLFDSLQLSLSLDDTVLTQSKLKFLGEYFLVSLSRYPYSLCFHRILKISLNPYTKT